MKYGVFIFPTDTAIRPDHLAREVEERGFEVTASAGTVPISRSSRWPELVGWFSVSDTLGLAVVVPNLDEWSRCRAVTHRVDRGTNAM